MEKHSNMARHNNTENPCKSNDGFTLIESLAAWTILLIAVTIFLKCLGMAHSSLGRGTVMRKQYMAALECVELEKEPLRTKETKLRFKINNHTISMDAVIMEYGMSWTGEGHASPVTLKVIGPVPKSRE
ncbi:prepilin-type N-terminal cleavage/methylation domain-containing protein [Hungatella sp. L12]|uniref:Prepilin-type N-terminal cleavage/methylation domain-containing protein n=2 Tax=Lachnospiraceae TaxID=186803 RepID=A0ABR7HA06_9FIRM|nr:prepilin-type N-terminal cleavage/methylation domain-containing protein [Hungatella hominis]